jgi:hypothetical protein
LRNIYTKGERVGEMELDIQLTYPGVHVIVLTRGIEHFKKSS